MIATLRESTAHVFVDSVELPVLTELDAHHLLNVLRVRPHDQVTVCDGKGNWRSCVVDANSVVEPTSEIIFQAAPMWQLTVAFSIVKGDRPEWTVQKLTELGIDHIVPLAPTSRSVVRWQGDQAQSNVARFRRISREAAMQSRRTWLAQVHDLTPIASLKQLFVADPSGVRLDASHHTIAIGPEGGFSLEETTSALGSVALGETILRSETAAISAGVLMANYRQRGDV